MRFLIVFCLFLGIQGCNHRPSWEVQNKLVQSIDSLESYKKMKKHFTKKRFVRRDHDGSYQEKTNDKEQYNPTPPEHIRTIYQLVRDTKEILDAHKIVWWADSGTLLGVERHKGIIPWDDDADIFIHPMHGGKLWAIRDAFKKYGLNFRESFLGFKVSFDDEWSKNNPINGYHMTTKPDLDIFTTLFAEEDHEEVHYLTDDCQWGNRLSLDGKVLTSGFYAESEIRTLKEGLFGSFSVFIPNNPAPYLVALYGDDYMKVARQTHSHNDIREGGIKAFKMTNNLIMPGEPASDSVSRVQEPVQNSDWIYDYYHPQP